ncbi:ketopantoate reductase [Albimonas donghaensis]|uniref:2-dehydropantoate 2-reductase n=1 Tax=Albimonas donghaensis TaxID=356660 RepID=A0A1H3F495_9RHOB|nr:2-dehydropantoate 2-reductase [Albimonas donghaensis]SDX85667.1 ketopantoate reductase [Albimonas donghaensis]
MKVAVVGAGGIGGYLAVRLAAAGNPVSVVARGAHLDAIRARGLTLEEHSGKVTTVQVPASADPGDLGPADLVIFGVKGHQLDDAMEMARPLMAGGGVALPILNGVTATPRLEAVFGEGRALIGTAQISAEIVRPGVIGRLDSETGLVLGDRDGRQDTEPAASVRAMLLAAGAPAPESDDVRVDLWRKMIAWNGTGTLTAAARCHVGDVQASPELRRLYEALVREAYAVAVAAGAPVPADTPDKVLARFEGMSGAIRSSMAADLEAGRALEVDHMTGAVARMGRELGVPVPATEAMCAVLVPHRDGRG